MIAESKTVQETTITTKSSIADISDVADVSPVKGHINKLSEFLKACHELAKIDGYMHIEEFKYLAKEYGLTNEEINKLREEGKVIISGERVIING